LRIASSASTNWPGKEDPQHSAAQWSHQFPRPLAGKNSFLHVHVLFCWVAFTIEWRK
jgi:hypothetical protein